MGYCLFLIAPWMLRYIINWLQTSSVHIQSVASLELNSSSRLPELRRRMVLILTSMLSGLLSASMAASTWWAMASEVWAGSKMGSGPVGWISTCLSWTTARAMAGVACVGASA